jgi:hypothetical protein
VTHHLTPPTRAADLRPKDTVDVSGTTTGPSGRFATNTPCCGSRVFIHATDVAYMERRPSYTVTRTCTGCDWPYFVRVASPLADHATFTVCQPPRDAHAKH